jgi:hypothetical protein
MANRGHVPGDPVEAPSPAKKTGGSKPSAGAINGAAGVVKKVVGTENSKGKPSTARSAVGGAATGAATGATIGSVVPGVGTAVGAGVGAVAGGAGGALKGHSAKKTWKAAKRGNAAGARRALIAEFLICILILALSPVARPAGDVKPADWMKRGSAMCGVFILLGMTSSIGPRAARAAVALGGLITLALLLDQREIFGVLTKRLKKDDTAGIVEDDTPEDDTPAQPIPVTPGLPRGPVAV